MWRHLFTSFLGLFSRIVLKLRYRIEWKGLETVSRSEGVLFLPNHPGEIDPVILAAKLWPTHQPRPLMVEDFYYMPGLHTIMSAIRAFPVPDMRGTASAYKRRRVQHAVDSAIQSLKDGDSVLLYPAGRLMRDKVEILGATTAVSEVLQKYPDVNICLVRTTGLLGSSFAWYTEKQRPDLGKALKKGAVSILKNLIFFTPKRHLTIEFEMLPEDIPRTADKLTLNRKLEDWYNAHGPEEPTLVSYSMWSEDKIEVVEVDETADETHSVEIPDDIAQRVTAALADFSGVKADDINPNMNLQNDLGFDSLNIADVMAWLEETYFVMDLDSGDLKTVYDVMAAAVGSVKSGSSEPPVHAPEAWAQNPERPAMRQPDAGSNIPYAFLENCDRMGDIPAIADDMNVLNYPKLKLGVLALAEVFKEFPEKRLGIMLPASVGADLVIMATLVCGKVPVMINWTLGDANLEHVLEVSEIKHIITSSRFLDNLDHLNIDLIDEYIVTLETMKLEKITLGVKLKAMWHKTKSPAALAKRYGFDRFGPDDTAVILFTSGSESVPKGVPLSHRNIISDFNGAIELAKLTTDDCIFGFLPPFHSFGFTATTILPLLTGMRACYYPNPTESRKLARGCSKWKPTCCAGTPTFFAGLFKAATPDQLKSLRLMVSGAEKAPAELFEKGDNYGITILEGYGITETSPVLTITPADKPRVGVGVPIGDVKLVIVNENDRTPVPTGTRGLILAAGSNVFDGYLGRDSTDAFHDIDGTRYYVTGDLGFLDDDGNLTISGRLKRFVKIGGEMISLPAMEEALQKAWPQEDGEANLAISAYEKDGERPVLCLFTTLDNDLESANAVLKDSGFPNLARLNDLITVSEIPLLGTGKSDYQTLKKKLTEHIEGA